jgi:predicted Zn-dependent protease
MKKIAAALALTLLATTAHAARPGAFLVSEFAAHQGNLTLAAAAMQNALQGDPSSPALREDAFILDLLAGLPDAITLAQTLPENPLAQLLLAAQAAHDGNWQSAELAFAELPHQKLADAIRPVMLAWAQEAQGNTDRAMDTLQPSLTSGELGAISLLHAALIADAAHRDGLAQRLYTDLSHAQAHPSLQFGRILASWQARAGDITAARATIDGIVDAAPDLAIARPGLLAALTHAQAPNPAHGMAMVLVELAAAAQGHDGKPGQDTQDVGQLLVQVALVLDPGMADAYLLAAEIAGEHKQPALAMADLEKIAPTDPLSPVVQLRLANLYARNNRVPDALALLHRLAAAYPNRPDPLIALGDVFSDQKQFTAAIQSYDQAIAMIRHPKPNDWVIFYARGAAEERAHQWPRAEADMNRALELQPDQPYVLNFLGFSLADRNEDLPLAHDMIARALNARPNDGAIVDSMGWVLLRQGDTAGALRLLEKAAELEPEDPSITGHLGDAYWSAGRRIEAEDQWRRALVLNPEPDDQARIEARLKSATTPP